MPLNPPTLATGFLTPNFLSVGNIGTGVPRLAMGIAIGVCQYLTVQAKVQSQDTGTLGVGTTIFPLLVPPPLLQAALLQGFAAMGIMGIMAPLTITGLANGLTSGWGSTALLSIQHPSVGTGAGVARIVAPSAAQAMIQGFAAMAMTGEGPTKMARAIGVGLDVCFASFFTAVPIVGSASTSGGVGVGLGSVI
jgi:hypothetical protein